ncbi:MAG: glycine cleavage system protein GcvH [Anaerolineae bacterium]|nr:glycine cleavage system protein GcvH [Anaerolineae bacterium]
MSAVPGDLYYARSHEWVKPEGKQAVIGISDYAQEELTDVVYVELPEVGDEVEQGKSFAIVESVKAASDVLAPVSGTVVAVNEALADRPELINESPYDQGWFIRIEMPSEDAVDALVGEDLMDGDAYETYLASLAS